MEQDYKNYYLKKEIDGLFIKTSCKINEKKDKWNFIVFNTIDESV